MLKHEVMSQSKEETLMNVSEVDPDIAYSRI